MTEDRELDDGDQEGPRGIGSDAEPAVAENLLPRRRGRRLFVIGLALVAAAGFYSLRPEEVLAPVVTTSLVAPRHVVADQAGSDGVQDELVVTWSRSDPRATAYEVVRDGAVLGEARVTGEPWDDLLYRDVTAEPGRLYSYQVRAARGAERSPPSTPVRGRLRGDVDVAGRIFRVDTFPGTDLVKAQAAVDAALTNGGGVVLFGPRKYLFGSTLRVTGDRVTLRGAGRDATTLQADFAGTPAPCDPPSPLVEFKGTPVAVTARLSAPIAVGDRETQFADTSGLVVGQAVIFDQRHDQNPPQWFAERSVPQDPGSGDDRRYNWDANEVVALAGTKVTFRFPFSQPFTTAVVPEVITKGLDNAVESLTVQGRGPDEKTFHRLIDVNYQAHFVIGDVRGRWANRNEVRVRGYDVHIVGFHSPDGGPAGFDGGQCRYRISVQEAANVTVVDGVFGDPTHDRNQDFVVTQWAQRVLVRHNRFYGSRTMAINEHGGGSAFHIYENNFLATGPNSVGAIFLGNSVWGFGGPAIIRNNRFEGNQRDLVMFDHPYEVRFLDNSSVGCTNQCVLWSGWGGVTKGYAPIPDPDKWGSARLTIARNVMRKANIGIHLGFTYAKNYPYLGVKDVVIEGNTIESASFAVRMFGSATSTGRYQVFGNSGTNNYQHPPFDVGDYWAANEDSQTYGLPRRPTWSSDMFAWQDDGLVPG